MLSAVDARPSEEASKYLASLASEYGLGDERVLLSYLAFVFVEPGGRRSQNGKVDVDSLEPIRSAPPRQTACDARLDCADPA